MKDKKKSASDEKFRIALGKRIEQLILSRGYKSPYEFWLENGGDGLSRSNLNYILVGKNDPKLSTLRHIAEALEVDICELLNAPENGRVKLSVN